MLDTRIGTHPSTRTHTATQTAQVRVLCLSWPASCVPSMPLCVSPSPVSHSQHPPIHPLPPPPSTHLVSVAHAQCPQPRVHATTALVGRAGRAALPSVPGHALQTQRAPGKAAGLLALRALLAASVASKAVGTALGGREMATRCDCRGSVAASVAARGSLLVQDTHRGWRRDWEWPTQTVSARVSLCARPSARARRPALPLLSATRTRTQAARQLARLVVRYPGIQAGRRAGTETPRQSIGKHLSVGAPNDPLAAPLTLCTAHTRTQTPSLPA